MTETAETLPILPTNPGDIVRTKKDGAFKVIRSKAWGDRFEKCEDPEGKDIKTDVIVIPKDFCKIPAREWYAWVSLAFHFLKPPGGKDDAPDKESEVSVIFARKRPDFNEWRAFVPRQTVGAASVDANLMDLCDIITGETLNGLPEEWAHAGSSHSHNSMMAFFSGTDDKNELTVPGVHIVIGRLSDDNGKRTYVPKASIVQRGKRYDVEFDDVVDTNRDAPYVHYHAKCLEYVKKEVPKYHGFMSHAYGLSAEDIAEYASLFDRTRFKDRTNVSSHTIAPKNDDDTDTIYLPREGSYARQMWLKTNGATLDQFGNCWMPDGSIILADSGETIAAAPGREKPTAGVSKSNTKEERLKERLPLSMRLSLHDARAAAKVMHLKSQANAIRAICNAIEALALADNDDGLEVLMQLATDIVMSTDDTIDDAKESEK